MRASSILFICASGVLIYFFAFTLNAFRIAHTALKRKPLKRYMQELKERESYCPLDRISKEFQWTVTRMEDPRFSEHHGIDWRYTARALKKNVKRHLKKKDMFGGSGITQQLAKNLYLTPEKTFTRKLAELFLALYLEANLDKAKIVELYVNVIDYGHEQKGILPAAMFYYGVAPLDLSLNQSVTLACILPSPKAYNPMDNPEMFRKARSVAIYRLVARGLLPEETAGILNSSSWTDPLKEIRIKDIESNMPF